MNCLNCLLFIDKMERLERTHGIGSRDGFLLQWYWVNFKGLRSCCIPSCFNRDLHEMNFRCVTSLGSKSHQPASGRIRCNKNMIFLDAPNRSISYCFLSKECHFLSSQNGPRTKSEINWDECWGFSVCPIYDALVCNMNLRMVPRTEVPAACSCLHPRKAAPARVNISVQNVKPVDFIHSKSVI